MFTIEVDFQKQKGVFDKEDVSLSDAIFSTYPISPDKFQIKWNGIPVNLTFNSISDIVDDILCMLDSVVIGADFKCNFLCESFTVFFSFKVYLSTVEISSRWVSVNTDKEFFDLLNHDKKILIIDRRSFVGEWLKLLLMVKKDLQCVGYEFSNLNFKICTYSRFSNY